MAFSDRLPAQLAANKITRTLTTLRSEGHQIYDLTSSNPTAVGLAGDSAGARRTLESAETENLRSAVTLVALKADEGDLGGAMEITMELQDRFADSPVPFALEAELHMKGSDLVAAFIIELCHCQKSPGSTHSLKPAITPVCQTGKACHQHR